MPNATMNESTAVRAAMPELLLRDGGQDAALEPDHAADESIDEDQQRELRPVLAQAEAHGLADTC